MNKKDKIEMARTILNNAANINASKAIIVKISQKMDEYIVEYYRQNRGPEGSLDERENV